MNYKNYIKNGKLILPEGFNSILPEGFNSPLYCYGNKLSELILPEGFK